MNPASRARSKCRALPVDRIKPKNRVCGKMAYLALRIAVRAVRILVLFVDSWPRSHLLNMRDPIKILKPLLKEI